MQTSVKTVLHTTSETKPGYCMKKSTSGYEHDAGRKEYIWTVYMCTVFVLMINSCKIMRGSKSHAITQTIHTNLMGLICDVGYRFSSTKVLWTTQYTQTSSTHLTNCIIHQLTTLPTVQIHSRHTETLHQTQPATLQEL